MLRDDIDVSPNKSFKNMVVADSNYHGNEKKYSNIIPWNVGECEKVYNNDLTEKTPTKHTPFTMINGDTISFTSLYNDYDLTYNRGSGLYRWSLNNNLDTYDDIVDIPLTYTDTKSIIDGFTSTYEQMSYTVEYKDMKTMFNEYYMDAVGNIYYKNKIKKNPLSTVSTVKNDIKSIEAGELDRYRKYTKNNLIDILYEPELEEKYLENNHKKYIGRKLFNEPNNLFENEINEHGENLFLFIGYNDVLKKDGVRFCPWLTYKDLYRKHNDRMEVNYASNTQLRRILYGESKEEYHYDSSDNNKNLDYDLLVTELIDDITSLRESRGPAI